MTFGFSFSILEHIHITKVLIVCFVFLCVWNEKWSFSKKKLKICWKNLHFFSGFCFLNKIWLPKQSDHSLFIFFINDDHDVNLSLIFSNHKIHKHWPLVIHSIWTFKLNFKILIKFFHPIQFSNKKNVSNARVWLATIKPNQNFCTRKLSCLVIKILFLWHFLFVCFVCQNKCTWHHHHQTLYIGSFVLFFTKPNQSIINQIKKKNYSILDNQLANLTMFFSLLYNLMMSIW